MSGWSFQNTVRRSPRSVARLVTLLVWLVVAVLALGLAAGRTQPRRAHAQVAVPMAQRTVLAAAGGGRAALLAEARGELAAMRDTQYQHETEVDAAKGEFYYDCSGFLDYALKRAAPAAFRALPVTASSGRPLAQDFEHHLRQAGQGGDPWRSVSTVPALQPGDVIAWLATPDSKTRDTGHVMIVLGTPTHNPRRSDEWLVKVADSTVSPHAQDSRTADDDGLGTGTVGLVADGTGHPVGFYWRGGVSKVAKRTEVALGRIG
jgi:hypothetical protein